MAFGTPFFRYLEEILVAANHNAHILWNTETKISQTKEIFDW